MKKWIAGAIKHKGALHEDLGVPEGKKISASKLASAAKGNYGPTTARRARLAETLKDLNKSEDKKFVTRMKGKAR